MLHKNTFSRTLNWQQQKWELDDGFLTIDQATKYIEIHTELDIVVSTPCFKCSPDKPGLTQSPSHYKHDKLQRTLTAAPRAPAPPPAAWSERPP